MINYSGRVLEHFFNPRNTGEIAAPSGEGFAGNPDERNYMHFTISVVAGTITEARFQCYTCLVAVAACSLLTEMAAGKTVEAAAGITPQDLADALGGVPPERVDRCELAISALRSAINDYRGKNQIKGA